MLVFSPKKPWEEAVPDTVTLSDPEHSASHASANLQCMGSLILQSMRKDLRICGIKGKDHYCFSTLLNHHQGKVSELILPLQREVSMKYLEDTLQRSLCNAFPDSGRLQSHGKACFEASVNQRRSGGEGGRLSDAFKKKKLSSVPRAVIFKISSASASYDGRFSRCKKQTWRAFQQTIHWVSGS